VFLLVFYLSHILPISGNGRCYGVLPIVTAIVPVLKVTDQGTGVECDISVENKDGMSRSMIFKFISSIDERFRILCFLVS
jgi:DNA polymerase sigma